MPVGKIEVVGLPEFRRELRRLEDDDRWRPVLREAGLGAARIVADEAQSSARSASNPRMGSRAAGTIRALAGQTRATVAVGTAAVPWTMGHEWGSERFRQFPPKRKGGYHVYPAIERKQSEVLRYYTEALERISRDAFPN